MWNESILSETKIAIYGNEMLDSEGNLFKPLIGYDNNYFVIFGLAVTDKLKPYISSKTPNEVFEGNTTILLEFKSFDDAKTHLADYWIE